jgi:hypothetical protein
MRIGPIAHGVLLIAALAFGYQTWQREKKVEPKTGKISLWDEPVASFQSLQYDEENKSVRVEVRGEGDDQYLWGIVKTSRKAPPKPKDKKPEEPKPDESKPDDAKPDDAKPDDAKPDDAKPDDAKPDDAEDMQLPEPEPEPEPELITTTREFPLGDDGDQFRKDVAGLRALRDLGVLNEEKKEEYGLNEGVDNITMFFKGGKQRTLIVGKRVFGGSDRYMIDPENGKGYVLSSEIMNKITGAEHSLGLKNLHGFKPEQLGLVTVETPGKERTLVKAETDDPEKGKQTTWADKSDPTKPDLTLANFLDRVDKLKPSEYVTDEDATKLDKIATIQYRDYASKNLGYLELYRKEAAEVDDEEDGVTADPKRPKPAPQPEYFIKTARTRVLGKVSKLSAERVHQDLAEMFGAVPVPAAPEPETPPQPAPKMPDPHGGPAGPADPHGGPADPHGGPADPHGGPAGPHSPPTAPTAPKKDATAPATTPAPAASPKAPAAKPKAPAAKPKAPAAKPKAPAAEPTPKPDAP